MTQPPKFSTNFLYTNRETKSNYVWLKYQSILKNSVLDVGDVNGLLHSVEQLKDNLNIHESCRTNALKDVKAYTWETIAGQNYQELYQHFLGD